MTKNKTLLSIICAITFTSSFSYADLIYRFSVPKPDFISNDWDNDGQPNDIDTDDDNDGILDIDDSTPFDRGGQSSVPNVLVHSFSVNPVSYFVGDAITLSWNIDNIRTLSLYNDSLLTNFLGDVSNQNSITLIPNGDVTYYLDTETSVEEKSVFQYNEISKNCGSWNPDPSTVNKGISFTQNRDCTINYSSNEPSTTSKTQQEYQLNVGTLITVECVNRSSSKYFQAIKKNLTNDAFYVKWGTDADVKKQINDRERSSGKTIPLSEENSWWSTNGYRYWGFGTYSSQQLNGYTYNTYSKICRKPV